MARLFKFYKMILYSFIRTSALEHHDLTGGQCYGDKLHGAPIYTRSRLFPQGGIFGVNIKTSVEISCV